MSIKTKHTKSWGSNFIKQTSNGKIDPYMILVGEFNTKLSYREVIQTES